MRIRAILDGLKGTGRRPLLKHVPTAPLPANPEGRFPHALLAALPAAEKYSIIGHLTEALVLGTETAITCDTLLQHLTLLGHELDPEHAKKVRASKTTQDYLAKVQATQTLVYQKLRERTNEESPTIEYNPEITQGPVQGHPDGVCGSVVLEVKTTSKLEEDLPYFMLQLFSYVALGGFDHAILVLPLQQTALLFRTTTWREKTQDTFLRLLNAAVTKIQTKEQQAQHTQVEAAKQMNLSDIAAGRMLFARYPIGYHVPKRPTVLETVQSLPPNIPHQIFLGGNQTTRLSVKEADLLAAAAYVQEHNIVFFVHSPYLINLSSTTEDSWQTLYLRRLLEAASKAGARGVVVHVGKHTAAKTYEEGITTMRESIEAVLDAATPHCPLLLETPAGQGTETLQTPKEFLDFVESFHHPHLRVCVDTCHVYANGHDPLVYVQAAQERDLLHLVHFNDSQECCGACKDRHAPIGGGKIGIPMLTSVAEFCFQANVPMLYE
jgi:deoxyribonuclease-4